MSKLVKDFIQPINCLKIKIDKEYWQIKGEIPVISQDSEKLISGYVNSEQYSTITDIPLIVYGDHTSIFKYIDFEFICGADGVQLLKPKSNFYPKYFYYVMILLSPYIPNRNKYQRHFKYLKEMTLERFLIDKIVQKKIAKVLSDLDAKIELNNKINQELEAMAKTLYDYWFVQFDFPDPSTSSGQAGKPYKSSGGKMVYNEELKREIPEGWEVKELNYLLKKYIDKSKHIKSKKILKKGRYPVITQDNREFIAGFANEENPIIDIPLIVFGDHSCTLRYIDFPFFRGADGTQILLFDINLTSYIYLYLQKIIKQITNYAKYERHYKYLKEFKIVIPDSKLLEKFQIIIEPLFEKISKNRFENQQLTALRDWLLPMLMNGQVTVKEVEEKLSMAAEPQAEYKKR